VHIQAPAPHSVPAQAQSTLLPQLDGRVAQRVVGSLVHLPALPGSGSMPAGHTPASFTWKIAPPETCDWIQMSEEGHVVGVQFPVPASASSYTPPASLCAPPSRAPSRCELLSPKTAPSAAFPSARASSRLEVEPSVSAEDPVAPFEPHAPTQSAARPPRTQMKGRCMGRSAAITVPCAPAPAETRLAISPSGLRRLCRSELRRRAAPRDARRRRRAQ
jgi:hypothetical protein